MHSIAKLIQLRSDLKISVVWFICQIVVGNILNVLTLPVVETRGFSVLRGLPSGTDMVL